MKAIFNDKTVADADKKDLIYIEGKWYFPPSSVKQEYFSKSDTPYHCPWKGDCQYYTVSVDGQQSQDSAFTYPEPFTSAIEKVKKDFSGYFAFWRDIQIQE